MHTVSKDYIHKGSKAVYWKVTLSKWVPSINHPDKWNTEHGTIESSSPENAIELAQRIWEEGKWKAGNPTASRNIQHVHAVSVFPDGTDFVIWRSV